MREDAPRASKKGNSNQYSDTIQELHTTMVKLTFDLKNIMVHSLDVIMSNGMTVVVVQGK